MTWLAAQALWSTWWRALVGAALAAAPCFMLGQCVGAGQAEARFKAKAATAAVEALRTDGAAKEQAAGERLSDAQAVATITKDLHDAVADLPDDAPSRRRVALACARLRQQGVDLSGVPACR